MKLKGSIACSQIGKSSHVSVFDWDRLILIFIYRDAMWLKESNIACTNQSAEQYIRTARSRLVGKLKNISVIVENLYQREVLNAEGVSKINAERDDYDKTREMLEWVTNKGEAACYELLKIIDTTRKRTLERPVDRKSVV